MCLVLLRIIDISSKNGLNYDESNLLLRSNMILFITGFLRNMLFLTVIVNFRLA